VAKEKRSQINIDAKHAKHEDDNRALMTPNRQLWMLLIAVGVTLLVFLPSLRNGFVTNWDDNGYIRDYQPIKAFNWANIKIIFSTYHQGNYHPLTIFTYAIEYALVGLKPFLYHFDNLILHLLNVVLVFIFSKKLTKKLEIAFITALLFGIHPMHVESVAWVSERKDVLYTFFFMLAAICYVDYLQKPKAQARNFALSLIFFLIALLSKPAAVCFPGVILAIDWFRGRTFSTKLLFEKVPFIIIAVIFGIISIYAQKDLGAIHDLGAILSFKDRVFLSFYAIVQYLSKFLLPVGLSAFHPYPLLKHFQLPLKVYAAPIIVLALLFILYITVRKNRIYLFGGVFFLVNIAMVLQLLPVGSAIIAERYSYVSYIGLFMIVGYMYCSITDSKYKNIKHFKTTIVAILVTWGVFLSIASFNRIKVWMRGDYLFEDILLQYQNQPFIYNNLADIYFKELKENDKALYYYNKTIEMDSSSEMVYCNRAILNFDMQRYPEALCDFNHTLRFNPKNTDALLGRANTLSTLGKFEQAISDYDNYIAINATNHDAYQWRGIAHFHTLKLGEAIGDFNKDIKMNPNNYEAYYWRGLTYIALKMYTEAITDLNKAIALNPTRVDMYANLGTLYYNINNFNSSIDYYTQAISINPNDASLYYNRAISLTKLKQWQRAMTDIDHAGKMGYPIDRNFYENVKRNTLIR